MTDPATGSTHVTLNPSTGERHLKRLWPSDWVRLGNTLRITRKARKREELRVGEASEDVAKEELGKLDKLPVKHLDILAFVNEPEGQYAAILLSLGKDKPGASADDLEADLVSLELAYSDWMGVAASLLNLQVTSDPLPESPVGGATKSPTGTPMSP